MLYSDIRILKLTGIARAVEVVKYNGGVHVLILPIRGLLYLNAVCVSRPAHQLRDLISEDVTDTQENRVSATKCDLYA